MTTPVSSDQDRPNSVPWPPIVQVAILACAWLLERLAPLDFLPDARVARIAGWLVFAVGLALLVSGARYFRSVGTPIDPTGRATRIADGGIFARTRNPMYLGMTVAMLGLGLALDSGWLFVLGLLDPLILQKLAIEPEEAYLSRRFGPEYAAYRARVRRWL